MGSRCAKPPAQREGEIDQSSIDRHSKGLFSPPGRVPEPVLLHFDVNKTVLFSDAGAAKSAEEGVRESISELFWGTTRKVDDVLQWTWTGTEPACVPPAGFEIESLMNYAQYCKKRVKVKALSKEMVRTWELVTDKSVVERMNLLLVSSMKRLEIPSNVRFTEEAQAAGLKGVTKTMLPAVFALVALLQRAGRRFAVLFRSFGDDHKKIAKEWNSFCEMKHPVYSHLLEGIGPMDGTTDGVPDRRIQGNHTLYRDLDGPMLILDTLTNGPAGLNSWDMWAKTKPKPKQDLRNGRQFIRDELKAKTVEGTMAIQLWMQEHVLGERTGSLKDDWAWWNWHGEITEASKLLTLTPPVKGESIKQLFFDDNIEHNDARIVDCRFVNGMQMPDEVAMATYISKVNPVLVLNDEDYFLKIFQRLHKETYYEGYEGAAKQFRQALLDQEQLHALPGFHSMCCSSTQPIRQTSDIFDDRQQLSLLFCYAQMQPKQLRSSGEVSQTSMTKVYGITVDMLVGRTLRTSDAFSDHLQDRCRKIIERIALVMQVQSKLSISPVDMAEALPDEFRAEWETLKVPMLSQNGKPAKLLQSETDTNVPERKFRFLCKGVHAYLAASALARTSGAASVDLPTLEVMFTDHQWASTLELLAEEWPHQYIDLIERLSLGFVPKDGKTFFHAAALSGHLPIFELLHQLSDRCKEIAFARDDRGQTPFHSAAGRGNDLICSLLLDNGAPLNAADEECRWPVHVAMQEGHFATGKLLADRWRTQAKVSSASAQATSGGHVNGTRPAPVVVIDKLDSALPEHQVIYGSEGGTEQLASMLLGQQVVPEDKFLETIHSEFPELRYFGEADSVEMKRAMGALLAVYWIVSNNYDAFVRSQAEEARMTKVSWESLQEWMRGTVRLTRNAETVRAILAFVAIMSVGKVKVFRANFTPGTEEFSMSLILALEEVPDAFPSFARLADNSKRSIIAALKASDFNFGQFLQAENTPANLLVVKEISGGGDDSVLGFFLFKIFAAMCGILGMKSLEGSIFMNEKMYRNFKNGLDVLGFLDTESAADVYNRFLEVRAKGMGLHFDAKNAESRALVRLACLARAFDPDVGAQVSTAFQQLTPDERQQLVAFLNADGISVKPALLLYNVPNMLSNRSKELSLELCLRMMLKLYNSAAKEYSKSKQAVVTIMTDELANYAGKCTDPEIFKLTAFDISRAAGEAGETQAVVTLKG